MSLIFLPNFSLMFLIGTFLIKIHIMYCFHIHAGTWVYTVHAFTQLIRTLVYKDTDPSHKKLFQPITHLF